MSSPSDRHFNLNLSEEAAMPSQDNIWRPSFISSTGPLTVGDSVMKNDMTAAVVARNLVTPEDNRLLSKMSDELAVKDFLDLSVQCAGSLCNMAQRLFARTHQVESLAAEVMNLKQEIRGLKHENKQFHRLAHNYATNMKRKIDQMQESDGQILLDHQRFVGLFQKQFPSSSRAVPSNKAPNDQPPMPPHSGAPPTAEALNDHPLVPFLSGLRRLLRLLLSSLCDGSLLYFSASCSFSTNFNVKIPCIYVNVSKINPHQKQLNKQQLKMTIMANKTAKKGRFLGTQN
ncbi:hypothetical protein COP2_035872 [Malus domestica]